jgi:hypothetical protein
MMGHAAYMRGSRTISAQACKDTGCWGCIRCKPDGPKPTPRPAGWGGKARQRAADKACRIVASAARYGLPQPTVEALTLAVQLGARVSEATARDASESAINPRQPRTLPTPPVCE